MSTLADLRPGDIYFGPIGGGAGKLIGVGQLLVAPWKHQLTWRTWWKIRHCGIVTQAATPGFEALRRPDGTVSVHGIGPMIAQAEPHGMETREIGAEHWTPEYVYLRPNYPGGEDQARRVAEIALRHVRKRIPYAFEAYPAIVAHRVHLPVPHLRAWLERVDDDGDPVKVMCSWALDAQLTLAGGLTPEGHVFDDGRAEHDVVPSEIYLRLLELIPNLIIRPGKPDLIPGLSAVRRPMRADLL